MSHFNPPPGTLYKPTAVESDGEPESEPDYSCDSSKCMENGSFDDDCSASPESASCNDGYHYTQGARSPTTCSCDCYTSAYPAVNLFEAVYDGKPDDSCREDFQNSGFEKYDSCCMGGPSDGLCCMGYKYKLAFATCCSKDNNPNGTSALHAGRSTGGCSTRAAPRRVAPRGGCRSF